MSSLASRLVSAVVLACAFAQPAIAATPATHATATTALLHPISVIKRRDLDFGYVSVGATAGTVVIDPNTDIASATGGALLIGGTPHAAAFIGAAGSSSVVNIKVPKQPVILTRSGGTETMTATKFTVEGLDKRTVAKAVAFEFRVGATLNVAANQAEGTYVGTFDVTVQYP